MDMFDRMDELLKEKGMSRRQLALQAGIPVSTLSAAFSRKSKGTRSVSLSNDAIAAIAVALGVSTDYLLRGVTRENRSPFWIVDLEEKLGHIGYSIGTYEEDAMVWINYPDGSLEVCDEDLQVLNEGADAFLRFQLQELKAHRKEDFRPHKNHTTE